jgi:hypothetical protein
MFTLVVGSKTRVNMEIPCGDIRPYPVKKSPILLAFSTFPFRIAPALPAKRWRGTVSKSRVKALNLAIASLA